MAGLSTAEKNRRKRERKKREKEERRQQDEALQKQQDDAGNGEGGKKKAEEEEEVVIEYVAEPLPTMDLPPVPPPPAPPVEEASDAVPDGLPPGMGGNDAAASAAAAAASAAQEPDPEEDMGAILRRFNQRASVAAVVSDDEHKAEGRAGKRSSDGDGSDNEEEDDEDREYDSDEDDDRKPMSKRKLREMVRPTVADLKRRVSRPDLVEAHDITAADPDFLIHLKGIPGTVPVPRHWGRKRKYLQGKRGFEKPPFQLPDFIIKTGITEIRDTVAEDEAKASAKQKNRSRVNPKMGNMDVDYKTLYEAFFKYQTKPKGMTRFGDLYYEGKEMETSTDRKPGGPFSKEFRLALGMISENSPPPWLINMQRYGPPPSYPTLSIPGLNAPLPNDQCQYGYHPGGWGKPPMDQYGRPLYGGNPFDPPGSGTREEDAKTGIVTSDGKTIAKSPWGMPAGEFASLDQQESGDEEESSSEEEDESSVEDMEESDGEGDEHDPTKTADGMESMLPPPPAATTTAPGDLRKQPAGDETPVTVAGGPQQPKQLYQVLEQTSNVNNPGGVFQSDVKYMVPGATSAAVPDGAESVLSKAIAPSETSKRKRKHDDDDEDGLDKNFKF